jgi:hypothetical protein
MAFCRSSTHCLSGILALMVLSFGLASWSPIAAAELPAEVEARPATLLGITGLSVNGRIQPHSLPTKYYFEYGPTAQYGKRTSQQSLPPRLTAHYRESWDEGWNAWGTWSTVRDHFKEGGASKGFVRYSPSVRDDHNHDDAVGTVHLSKYMYPGGFSVSGLPSAFLAAGDPDFRDARVKVAVRGNNWVPNGTELAWWSQSQSNIDINPDEFTLHKDYRHSNWLYSGHDLTDLLRTGKWERADYRLIHDTNYWSFAGNNNGEPRYIYWPIDEVQRHLNLDYFHMVVFVNTANRPTGSIDFDEFEVAYRNYSLLAPSNGGKLLSAPEGSSDAARLQDGWRHGDGKTWESASNPQGPQEFTYAFASPVTIEAVQIHQHPNWPSRAIEVLVSEDGQSWKPLVAKEMPKDSPHGPNHAFLLQRKLKAPARQAKVRILSGYQAQQWGLGEIEMFGTGATMRTDDDWYHVNLDISDLKAGEPCHYRLVSVNAAGTKTGADLVVPLPADTKPQAITGLATRIQATSAKVEGRLNPLGKRTQFYFEYGPDTKYGQQSESTYGGLQIVPRTAIANLSNLQPGRTYHYRLVGVNETGKTYGEDATFQTK